MCRNLLDWKNPSAEAHPGAIFAPFAYNGLSMTRICFLIAPLSGRDSPTRSRTDRLVREVLAPALAPLDFDVFHADHVDLPGQVMRQVIELTVTADLVVADLTDANPNVFLELGLRLATGKPVIQVSHDVTRLPFDV